MVIKLLTQTCNAVTFKMMENVEKVKQPQLRHDGTCSACIGGWLCKYHRLQGIRNDKPMKRLRVDDSRVSSLHQLESDEFYTVGEKVRML